MTELADYFQPSYRVSRERLLERAHALAPRHDVLVDSRTIDEKGPSGETLALDFAMFGARRPRHALVLSSGTHGVEGYTGSAIQHYVLERVLPKLSLADGTAIVLQHANNPYGFAWHRRVNEFNVDYNRNFCEGFDAGRCSPDYEALFEAINPTDLDVDNESRRFARLKAFAAEHGQRRFQKALTDGQYKYPHGMQFGGQDQQPGVRHLLALIREHFATAETVVWLDFHTGLGESGACELITGAMPDSARYRLSQKVWRGQVRSASAGESLSSPLHGVMDLGVERALPANCNLAIAFPEYGTYPTDRTLAAIRADNWLHQYGDLDDETGRRLKLDMLETFRPESPQWRDQVVGIGARLVDQALEHLPGIRRT
jgi:predicted deacylase